MIWSHGGGKGCAREVNTAVAIFNKNLEDLVKDFNKNVHGFDRDLKFVHGFDETYNFMKIRSSETSDKISTEYYNFGVSIGI